MPEDRSNTNGYSGLNDDTERDMGAKGGPTTTLGKPDDNQNISHPYNNDIQTQLAAKSTEKKDDNKSDDVKQPGEKVTSKD